jgi:hypothetical protein
MYSYSEITIIFSNCLSRHELEKARRLVLELVKSHKPVPGTRMYVKQQYLVRLRELIKINQKNQPS